MTSTSPPNWLKDFQQEFGNVLAMPLDFKSSHALPLEEGFSVALISQIPDHPRQPAIKRIGVYQKQVWFRFFQTFQSEFPLTSNLCGLWEFNQLVQAFLIEHPSEHWSLQHIGAKFSSWLTKTSDPTIERIWNRRPIPTRLDLLGKHRPISSADLSLCAKIDRAWTETFLAPHFERWTPKPEELERIGSARLLLNPSLRWWSEDSELSQLRDAINRGETTCGETHVPWPGPTQQSWIQFRNLDSTGVHRLRVESTLLRLLDLLSQETFNNALEQLQTEQPPTSENQLEALIPQWFAMGLREGWWMGIKE